MRVSQISLFLSNIRQSCNIDGLFYGVRILNRKSRSDIWNLKENIAIRKMKRQKKRKYI